MSKTLLITGATGVIGHKLSEHFATLGWNLRLTDKRAPDIATALVVNIHDLSTYDAEWSRRLFYGVDAVIHLAGNPNQSAPWDSIYSDNIETTRHVLRAALLHGVPRVVFASSNWVMGGYRFEQPELTLTTDLPPKPINPYGTSKLVGEQLGLLAAQTSPNFSFIAARIGYSQTRPGAHLSLGTWGQLMWLSDRDLCRGMELAASAELAERGAVLNLMSNNPGMRWDLTQTKNVIGYIPQDGAVPEITDDITRADLAASQAHEKLKAATQICAVT